MAGSVASKDPEKYIAPKRDKRPLYSHWFATDMYEISIKLKDSIESSNTISVEGRMYSLPPIDTLTKCATEFKNIVLFCTRPTDSSTSTLLHFKVRTHEDTFSSLLTPVFHNLFGTVLNVSVLSQLIIRIRNDDSRQFDKPDHTIAATVDGVPVKFIGVSDSKRLDAEEGKNQVHAYRLALESRELFLGLTITRNSMALQVFMGLDSKLSVIDICGVNGYEENELKIFLGTLYTAVQALAESPIEAPVSSFTVKCCGNDVVQDMTARHINLSRSDGGCLVLHCITTKMVRKYYDKNYHYIPSEDAISFIPSSKFLNPQGGRYQILQYPYIEGHHTLETPVQAAAAVRELNKFHEKDFVHGDIRSVNMIVSSDSVTFIDVDLVAKEGGLYPFGYNHYDIPERHSNAKAGYQMKKEHDRFALKILLPEQLLHCAAGLTDMNKSLEEIAVAIEFS